MTTSKYINLIINFLGVGEWKSKNEFGQMTSCIYTVETFVNLLIKK